MTLNCDVRRIASKAADSEYKLNGWRKCSLDDDGKPVEQIRNTLQPIAIRFVLTATDL